MELTKYKIGELIELTNEKNANGLYGEDDAIGVNIDKIIMPMRGNLEKKDFSNFHLVPPRHFAYNPRGSRKLGIGFNDTEKTMFLELRKQQRKKYWTHIYSCIYVEKNGTDTQSLFHGEVPLRFLIGIYFVKKKFFFHQFKSNKNM